MKKRVNKRGTNVLFVSDFRICLRYQQKNKKISRKVKLELCVRLINCTFGWLPILIKRSQIKTHNLEHRQQAERGANVRQTKETHWRIDDKQLC